VQGPQRTPADGATDPRIGVHLRRIARSLPLDEARRWCRRDFASRRFGVGVPVVPHPRTGRPDADRNLVQQDAEVMPGGACALERTPPDGAAECISGTNRFLGFSADRLRSV